MALHVYGVVFYWDSQKGCSIVNGKHRRRCRNTCKSAKRVDLLRHLCGPQSVRKLTTHFQNSLLSICISEQKYMWTFWCATWVHTKNNLWQSCMLNTDLSNLQQRVWNIVTVEGIMCGARWKKKKTQTKTTEGGAERGTHLSRHC